MQITVFKTLGNAETFNKEKTKGYLGIGTILINIIDNKEHDYEKKV